MEENDRIKNEMWSDEESTDKELNNIEITD